MTESLESSFPPELADRYEPVQVLGTGGMGIVMEARDRELDRPVAIKRIRGPASAQVRKRFRREASLLAGLHHPAIVELYSFHDLDSGLVLVMQLLEGRPLDHIQDGAAATLALVDVAGALEEVHAHDLVHRDVKPANVLRLEDGRGVLIDFGLVHDDRRTQLTVAGQVMGTLAFMDPAQLRGAPASPGADWYGWAASLYTVLTGRHPYEVDDLLAYASTARELSPPPPCDALPPDLQATLQDLLAPEAAARPAPTPDFLAGLSAWATCGPSRAKPRASSSASAPRPAPGPRPRWSGPAIAAALLSCLALGWWSSDLQPAGPPPPPATTRSAPPETSVEAKALDELWRDMARDHLGDPEAALSKAAFRSPRRADHQAAAAATFEDERFILAIRRLGKAFARWWESLPPDRTLAPADAARLDRLLPGLLAHLYGDLQRYTDHVDLTSQPPAVVAARAKLARRVRDEFEEEVRGLLGSLDLFTAPRGDATLVHSGAILELLPPSEVDPLIKTLRRRAVSGEVPAAEIGDGALHLGYKLARQAVTRCSRAEDLLSLGLDAAAAAPDLISRPHAAAHLVLAILSLDERCPGLSLPVTRTLEALGRIPADQVIPHDPSLLGRLGEQLQLRGQSFNARRIWWVAHKHSYLLAEPPATRAALHRGAWPDTPPLELASELEPSSSASRWAALLGSLLAAVEADSLRADPAGLERLLRALRERRTDEVPESLEVERLVLGTLYRLDRPLAQPRYDRILLLDALAGDLPFAPLWRLAWGNENTEMRTDGAAYEVIRRHFSPEELGPPIEARARGPGSFPLTPAPSFFWVGRSRGVQSLGPGQSSPTLLQEFTWWKLPERLQVITECLERGQEASACIQDRKLVESWLEDYRPPLGPARRAELVTACRVTASIHALRSAPAPVLVEPASTAILAAFRKRCSEVGVSLPGASSATTR